VLTSRFPSHSLKSKALYHSKLRLMFAFRLPLIFNLGIVLTVRCHYSEHNLPWL
jgi:hypothetical protein